MKRNQSTALARLFSSSLRLSLALGAAGVFASTGFAGGAHKDTYYVNDHLASTISTADAAGEIAQIESDAFGTQAGAVAKDSRFTGKPYDADMGAYVFPFRNYRSDEARWMSADPSGFPDGSNQRSYLNSALTAVDALGLAAADAFTLKANFSGLKPIYYIKSGIENSTISIVFTATLTMTYSASPKLTSAQQFLLDFTAGVTGQTPDQTAPTSVFNYNETTVAGASKVMNVTWSKALGSGSYEAFSTGALTSGTLAGINLSLPSTYSFEIKKE